MKVYVDTIYENNLGGETFDIRKVQYNLALLGITVQEFISNSESFIVSQMFGVGKFIFIVMVARDFSKAQMGIWHSDISIDDHFNSFADNLTPQAVQSFHELKVELGKLKADGSTSVSFSDNEEYFDRSYQSRKA